jgi:hypothetical protein
MRALHSQAFVRWCVRHGRALWLLTIVLAIPATARTVMLYAHLEIDLEELLPRDASSVVALCSLTTIVGCSSLSMAQNMALFRFGLLAVVGEIACLTVALVGLPAMLLTILGHKPAPPNDVKSWATIVHPSEERRRT